MADHLHLVFAIPSPATTDDEFNKWYRHHLDEILEIPGWLAARRYEISDLRGSHPLAGFRYLAVYEVGSDISANMAAMLSGKPSRRATSPDWVDQNRYASWNAEPLEGTEDFRLPRDAWFVLGSAPAGVTDEEFDSWHRFVAESARRDPLVLRSWSFRITPSPADEGATITPSLTRLTVYEAAAGFVLPELSRPVNREFPWHDPAYVIATHPSVLTERVEPTGS